MEPRLQRFKDAQDQPMAGFESALAEIRAGGKRSHWIWYVFPQLAGMGHSAMSQTYGLDGIDEPKPIFAIRSCVRAFSPSAAPLLNRSTASHVRYSDE